MALTEGDIVTIRGRKYRVVEVGVVSAPIARKNEKTDSDAPKEYAYGAVSIVPIGREHEPR